MTRRSYSGSRAAAVLVSTALWGHAHVAVAQRAMALNGAPALRDSIVATRLALLIIPDTAAGIGVGTRVARRSDGRFVAAPLHTNGLLGVFSANGLFERYVGTAPAPETRPTAIMAAGTVVGSAVFPTVEMPMAGTADTIFTLDFVDRMINVFDRDLDQVKSIPLENTTYTYAALKDGMFAVERIPSPDDTAPPISIIDREGRIRARLGRENIFEDGATTPGYVAPLSDDGDQSDPSRRRMVGVDPAGSTVWSFRRNRLDLSSWTVNGANASRLIGDEPWFHPWTVFDQMGGTTAPKQPITQAVQSDSDGTLWVYVLTAHEPWTPVRSASGVVAAERFDTMIAAISPGRAEVIAVRRFPGVVFPVSGCTCAGRLIEHPPAAAQMEVLSLRAGR